VFAADFNGDGRDDLMQLRPAGDVIVAVSTGTGFTSQGTRGNLGFRHHPAGPYQTFVGNVRR
jgi:hypothetical protein